jgi:hypothetical protein
LFLLLYNHIYAIFYGIGKKLKKNALLEKRKKGVRKKTNVGMRVEKKKLKKKELPGKKRIEENENNVTKRRDVEKKRKRNEKCGRKKTEGKKMSK